jgi:hypothetical protein
MKATPAFLWGIALILAPHPFNPQSPVTPAQAPGVSSVGVQPPERAFLLDTGTNSVIALSTQSASILGTASFESGHLTSMMQIPHSKRLAVFDRGTGKYALRFGWHPDSKSSMSLVDMGSMRVASRLELGWGLGQALATADGKRIAVLCPGYASNKPEEDLAAEVVLVDTEASRITGRFPVKTPVSLLLTSDSRTLILIKWNDKAEVRFFDIGAGKELGELSTSKAVTSAQLSTDGRYLYLLDPGSTLKKSQANGFLVVVSVSTRTEDAAIDVGPSPRGLTLDRVNDRILVLSDANPGQQPSEPHGVLRVFKGAQTVAAVDVANGPEALTASPDLTALYVTGTESVSILESSTLNSTGEIHVGKGTSNFAISPDGKRGIALHSGSPDLTVVDIEQKKTLATLVAGRKSQRGMRAAAAGLNAFATEMENYNSYFYAQQAANATGETQYYTVYHPGIQLPPPPNISSISISPDSRFAYAVSDDTTDVTIIDIQAGTVLSKVGISRLIRPDLGSRTIANGHAVAILGAVDITFIDTKTNERIKFDGEDRLKVGSVANLLNASVLKAFEVTPSGDRAIALVNHRVICLDTATMKEVGRQENFKNLEMMVFEEN